MAADESVSGMAATPAVAYDGEGVIYENLFDLKFRISPDAFFQVKTIFFSKKCVHVNFQIDWKAFMTQHRNCGSGAGY